MRLFRYKGKNGDGYDKKIDRFRIIDSYVGEPFVQCEIYAFGEGTERRSRFDVDVYWEDVETFINLFSDSGNQKARAIKALLEALKQPPNDGKLTLIHSRK